MSGGTQWPLPTTKSPKCRRRMALLCLKEILVQIESRTNSCSFHLPCLQASKVVSGSYNFFYCGLGIWLPLKSYVQRSPLSFGYLYPLVGPEGYSRRWRDSLPSSFRTNASFSSTATGRKLAPSLPTVFHWMSWSTCESYFLFLRSGIRHLSRGWGFFDFVPSCEKIRW